MNIYQTKDTASFAAQAPTGVGVFTAQPANIAMAREAGASGAAQRLLGAVASIVHTASTRNSHYGPKT